MAGEDSETNGTRVSAVENLVKAALDVKRVNTRIMFIKLTVGEVILMFMCIYDLQVGFSEDKKGKKKTGMRCYC